MDILDPFTVSKRIHHTWARTFTCRPVKYLQPRSIEEIRSIVTEASSRNQNVMLTGSGHSPSNMTMTNSGWVVNLDKFNRVIDTQADSSGKFTDVTVEAGMRVYELNNYLAQRGLCIQNLGSISDQSMAGIISTGTHGSTAYHGLVSQQIVDLSIMVASGEVIKCSAKENVDIFRAGLLSLGKLGIITHVTVRTVPTYTLELKTEVVSFNDLINNMWGSVWTAHEFVRGWWYPYADKVVLTYANKSDKPAENIQRVFDTGVVRSLYQFLLLVSVKFLPSITPWIERTFFKYQFEEGISDSKIYESVQGHNMDCLFSQFVNEWALPMNSGVEVLDKLKTSIDNAASNNEFYVHSPIEVRISNTTATSNDDNAVAYGAVPGNNVRPFLDNTPNLSPASSPDKVTNDNITLYLNATMYRPFGFNSPIKKWYSKFEKAMIEAGGKPHWAKNFLGPETPDNIFSNSTRDERAAGMNGLKPLMENWYGDDLVKWKEIRQKSDPNRIFLPKDNDWAEKNGLV